MSAKQQYTEAYRVARLVKTMFASTTDIMSYFNALRWNFSEQVFINALVSLS